MLSKIVDSGIEIVLGNFKKKKNKQIYVIFTQVLIIISIYITTSILKLNVDLATLKLDIKTIEIVNAVLGLFISCLLFLYILSISLQLIFGICEVSTSVIADKLIERHHFYDDKYSEISSWFQCAKLGNQILTSRMYDYFLICILMSIILKQNHHQLIYSYFKSIFESSNPLMMLIVVIIAFSMIQQLFVVIQAIHYNIFHFHPELKKTY